MMLAMFADHDPCRYGPGPWHATDDGDNEFVGCGATPLDAVTRLVAEMEPYAVEERRNERLGREWAASQQ